MSEFHMFESEDMITLFLIPVLHTSSMHADTSRSPWQWQRGSARPEKRLCLQGWLLHSRTEIQSLNDVSMLDPESVLPQISRVWGSKQS